MKKIIISILFASTVMTASPGLAVTTVYTDETTFLAALNNPKTEVFDDSVLDPAITVDSTVGNVANGLFNDRLVLNGANTLFTFANPINGFGAIFNLDPGGLGQGIDFALDGSVSFAATIPNMGGPRFFGFVSDTAFSNVRLTGGRSSGVAETYNLDRLSFGSLAGVPEPSVWAFMILGFGAIGGAMRRRQSVATKQTVKFAF